MGETVEYRACWVDLEGDSTPDVSAWTADSDEAVLEAHSVAAVADPRYDEVWIERRVCSEPERVLSVECVGDAHAQAEEAPDGE